MCVCQQSMSHLAMYHLCRDAASDLVDDILRERGGRKA